MAFILRVKAQCADADIAAKLVSSLSTMVGLQDTHPGVLMYHFCRPDPVTRPLYYEFTELYGNEGAFFGHSSGIKFMEAYSSVWPTDKITTVNYGYGTFTEKVKTICDNFLQCKYPVETGGSLLHTRSYNRESSLEGDGPVLLVGTIRAKDGKSNEILASITKLCSAANDGVVTCFGSVPENESAPNDIDMLQLCTSNSHLVTHFTSQQGAAILTSIRDNSTSIKFRGYGILLSEAVKVIQDVGIEVVSMETATGYVLHPHADPDGQ